MRNSAYLFAPLAYLLAAPPPSPLDRLPNDPAGAIVRRSIDHTGGWPAWAEKKSVQFKKTVVLYEPDGSIKRKRVQFHRYELSPGMKGRVEWEEDGKKYVLVNSGYEAVKLVDGKIATSEKDRNEARNATYGSHYVFGMPFKLTDVGAHLAPAGTEKMPGGVVVDKVRVTYDKGAGDSGGLHTWTYYFDRKTGRLVANNLNYEPGKYDYTEYLDERPVGNLLLPMKRSGYAANEKGKVGRKTSEILYEDIRFDVPLPAALFVLPRS
jgi:hypothetical protein